MTWTDLQPEEVVYTDQAKIRCMGCSKRMSRQRTFRAPLVGEVSRWELRNQLRETAAKWRSTLQGVCASCMRSGEYMVLPDGNFALRFRDSAAA